MHRTARYASRRIGLAGWIFVLAALASTGTATAADLERIRMSHADGVTRVVLDLTDVMQFGTGQAGDPARFFVDLYDASVADDFRLNAASTPLVRGVRTGKHKPSHVRVVLDLVKSLDVNTIVVGPDGSYGHRLVIDLADASASQISQTDTAVVKPRKVRNDRSIKAPLESKIIGKSPPEKIFQQQPTATTAVQVPAPQAGAVSDAVPQRSAQKNNDDEHADGTPSVKEDRVIVIDPGHGGKDPGAVGRKKTYEKDVVLAIARLVAAQVNEISGYRAIMTRNDDTFVALRRRAEIARENHAYAFISIHADGSKRASAKGSSVYSLTDGAKTNARTKKLAEHMNANDVVQDDSVGEENANNRNLVDTLMALSTAKTQELGFDLGKAIMKELKQVTSAHTSTVEKANFRVLLAPGVPTILVETGFITNPKEEKLLRSKSHQKATAKAIVNGLKQFLKENESKLTNAEGQRTRG